MLITAVLETLGDVAGTSTHVILVVLHCFALPCVSPVGAGAAWGFEGLSLNRAESTVTGIAAMRHGALEMR